MAQFLLSAHSFVCHTAGYAVFLDLRRDTYSVLDPGDVAMLSGWIRGWADGVPLHAPNTPDATGRAVAMKLLSAGLITDDEVHGKSATAVVAVPAEYSLRDGSYAACPLSIRDVLRFIRAWLVVTLMLRCWPLERTVGRVYRRSKPRLWADDDFERARALASVYFRLQPRMFSPIDACLRNSLTFVEFLSCYALYPTWMFGVRMLPEWAAHSWVQQEDVVLNDTVAHVNIYTPIMAV